ncbi:hypothetical protein BU26DRAFT_83949 [Trematosphaeria pertusa]|uniref:Uncharacterized protein n=1 Tax=Trematosphaeria pertusa TaxID=390896 RepID=A0A6A6I310_9PLEO|nr:uncharacterized protein BU26DRAFT_83949 [Trematosphaeria pertusa]KAF2244667.1 hypothetical protein BU26DRAFT_83949 [Trematosphaeria pertusa]
MSGRRGAGSARAAPIASAVIGGGGEPHACRRRSRCAGGGAGDEDEDEDADADGKSAGDGRRNKRRAGIRRKTLRGWRVLPSLAAVEV